MIYTLTLNPAIDLFIDTNTMIKDQVNRTNYYDVQANGKGVNVSLILKQLEIENTAICVGGGFTSQYIDDFLKAKNIPTIFYPAEGITRINVFTKVEKCNEEYKLVNPGPKVLPQTVQKVLQRIEQLKPNDWLIVSGSFSTGIKPDMIEKIAEIADKKNFNLVIDTSYQTVTKTLSNHPYLLKPDQEEICSWFGDDVQKVTRKDYVNMCQQLIQKGAQRVLLSLGGDGALYVDKEHVLYGTAPKGKVVNTACSGDTMLATFIGGIQEQMTLEANFKCSLAAGSSTAFREGLTDFSDVKTLTQQVEIKRLKG